MISLTLYAWQFIAIWMISWSTSVLSQTSLYPACIITVSVIPSYNARWTYICICWAVAPGNFITYAVQFDNLLLLSPFTRLDPKTMQYVIGPPGALFSPRSRNKTKNKKKMQLQKKFLCSQKWNFLAPILEKILHFLKSKLFLYFRKWNPTLFSPSWKKITYISQETETPKTSYVSGNKFPNSKKKKRKKEEKRKRKHLKNFLYFGKCNFLATNLKNFLYFRKELKRPKKQI